MSEFRDLTTALRTLSDRLATLEDCIVVLVRNYITAEERELALQGMQKFVGAFNDNLKESELALTRLEVRAEMKSKGEEEISAIIDERTLEVQRFKVSEPPKDKLWAIPVVIVRRVSPTALAWLAALALVLGALVYILTKMK